MIRVSELRDLLSLMDGNAIVFVSALAPGTTIEDEPPTGPVLGVVSRARPDGTDTHVMLLNFLTDHEGAIHYEGTPSFQRLVIDSAQPREQAEAQALEQCKTPMTPIRDFIKEERLRRLTSVVEQNIAGGPND